MHYWQNKLALEDFLHSQAINIFMFDDTEIKYVDSQTLETKYCIYILLLLWSLIS